MKHNFSVSVIVTAWMEPSTVGPLIKQIEDQFTEYKINGEILLVCPDEETRDAGLEFDYLNKVRWFEDEKKGKPAALNIAFSQAKGDIWVLTDGDVQWEDSALDNLLNLFNTNVKIGAVTGHPVPINSRDGMLGYWSHLLTEMAHLQRLERFRSNRFLVCSGYLFAIRKNLVDDLPAEVLSDDALISYKIANQGYGIGYAPNAKVKVKFPSNFKDWIKQKARSGGGYAQLPEFVEIPKDQMRTFSNEVSGIMNVFRYAKNAREFWWTILLLFARLYLWIVIFWERRVVNKSFEKTWVRVESTK